MLGDNSHGGRGATRRQAVGLEEPPQAGDSPPRLTNVDPDPVIDRGILNTMEAYVPRHVRA